MAAGAGLDARNTDGNNALWLACVGNHLDVIDVLIDSGIDINNRNDNGATALMYASSSGKSEVVAQLLAKGADTTFETPDGFTALDMAATIECLALLRRATRTNKAGFSRAQERESAR
jgi:thiosulfate/3-mercaptopyruvate sulfurtransferase